MFVVLTDFCCDSGLGGTSTTGIGGSLFGTTPGLGSATSVSNTGFSTPLFNRTSAAGGMSMGGGALSMGPTVPMSGRVSC